MLRLGLVLFGALLWMGCEPTSPSEAPDAYRSLVRQVISQAQADADTTLLYFRNTEVAPVRSRMLELKLEFVSYDRSRGLVCAWRGGSGVGSVVGYALPVSDDAPPRDSLGRACYARGTCRLSPADGPWTRFDCQ